MREQTVSASSIDTVDARENGGITIKGWDRADVLVRAQVRTNAPTDDQAKDLARQINVQAAAWPFRRRASAQRAPPGR